MSTLAFTNNEHADVSITSNASSTLSQRVKALEEAGMHDRLVKKRIPSYAVAAAAIGNELQQLNVNNLYSGNTGLTKIYQNPSNFNTIKLNDSMNSSFNSTVINKINPLNDENDKSYRSSIASNERGKIDLTNTFKLNRIYKSNSSESIDLNNKSSTASKRSSTSNSTITNDRTIVENDLVDKIKNLKKVSTNTSRSSSSISAVPVDEPLTLKPTDMYSVSASSPISPHYSPNNLTSFSKKTAQLIADSLRRSNDDNLHIPISIPLVNSKISGTNIYSSQYEPTDIDSIENDVESKRSSMCSPIETRNRTIISIDSKKIQQIDDQNSRRSSQMSSSTKNALSSHLSTSSNDLLVTTTPFKAPSYEQLNTSHDFSFRNNNKSIFSNQQLKSSIISTPSNSSNNSNLISNKNTSLNDDYINSNSNPNNTANKTDNNNNSNSRSQLVSIFSVEINRMMFKLCYIII